MRIFFAVWINCGFSKPFPPHLIKFMLEILMLNSLANSNFKLCKKFLFYAINYDNLTMNPYNQTKFLANFSHKQSCDFTISDMISKFSKLSKSSHRRWVIGSYKILIFFQLSPASGFQIGIMWACVIVY